MGRWANGHNIFIDLAKHKVIVTKIRKTMSDQYFTYFFMCVVTKL